MLQIFGFLYYNKFIMIFPLFHVLFNIFFTIRVVIGNAKLKFALAIPTGAPITVANDDNKNAVTCCRQNN